MQIHKYKNTNTQSWPPTSSSTQTGQLQNLSTQNTRIQKYIKTQIQIHKYKNKNMQIWPPTSNLTQTGKLRQNPNTPNLETKVVTKSGHFHFYILSEI